MPRRAAGLTAAGIKTAKVGRHGDGGGLYLLVRSAEARFWVFRYTRDGKMREMGLGAATGRGAVSLAAARDKARRLHDAVRGGRDPLEERAAREADAKAAAQRAEIARKTFRDVAQAYINAHEAAWRNEKHRQQWNNTLATYAYPVLGDLPVAAVGTGDVMAVLEPIWESKPETASRLRGRLETVLAYAKARGWCEGENPARWRGHVANMLPARAKLAKVKHHPALHWRDVGVFVALLRAEDGLAARALELTILTAARTSEVLKARWSEIDLDKALWVVPADRMKAGRKHDVPLSGPAVELLRKVLPLRNTEAGDWVFPGTRKGRPLSNMAMLMLLRRMERGDLTAHGFRSTFRDWCAESTNHPREVAEKALAHILGDKTEAAYQRNDMLDKRRTLMEEWAAFCGRPAVSGEVVPIRGAVAA